MDEVNQLLAQHYNATFEDPHPFTLPKDPEPTLKQLLFLLHALIERGYTLSAICPTDFEYRDNVLFLKKDTHVVQLEDGHFMYTGKACFAPGKPGRYSLAALYRAVATFAYYLWTHEKEIDLEKIKGTKAYYFIRNATEKHPILLYL